MASRNPFEDRNYILENERTVCHRRPAERTQMKNFQNLNTYYHSHEEAAFHRYVGSGVAFLSVVADNLLCHPFQVLRRQCQVHHCSVKYHLVPFSLIPTIYHLHQHQGLTTLWKGLGSVLIVRGMTLGVEDLLSKLTPWPKDISNIGSLRQFCQHILLKCLSFAIVTPFYSASFVETVQSDIASDKPGLLDVFREGFLRLLNWSSATRGRMIPIWALIVPAVTLGLAKYLFSVCVRGASVKAIHLRYRYQHEANGAMPKDYVSPVVSQDIEFTSSLIANIVSDVAFYPCETIIHRLYLQGTRTIVDNLDTGSSVLSILTSYTGAVDCYNSCMSTEGTFGLYKGFGALILQHAVHIALIHVSRFLLTEVGSLIRKPSAKDQLAINSSTPPPVIHLNLLPYMYPVA